MLRSLIILLFCVGCTRKVYVPQVRVEKTIDTLTQILPDSATLRALFECDSLGQVRLREIETYKGKEASQNIDFSQNTLKVETRWRTQYIDRIHQVHDTVTIVEIRPEIKQVKHIPRFFWWCFAVAVLTVGYAMFKLLRKVM